MLDIFIDSTLLTVIWLEIIFSSILNMHNFHTVWNMQRIEDWTLRSTWFTHQAVKRWSTLSLLWWSSLRVSGSLLLSGSCLHARKKLTRLMTFVNLSNKTYQSYQPFDTESARSAGSSRPVTRSVSLNLCLAKITFNPCVHTAGCFLN